MLSNLLVRRDSPRVYSLLTYLHQPLVMLGVLLWVVAVLSVFVGRYPAPYWMRPADLWKDSLAQTLVLNLRLPRLLMACWLGMTLAASGSVLQMVFRNPLVEPGFLGVSQGAAFGAALAMVLPGGFSLLVPLSATLFAMLGLALSYLIASHVRYGGWILRLVLAGIAVSALFSAGVGILKYVADPLTQLPEIVFWMMGGLWSVTWADALRVAPIVLPCLVVLYRLRWRLNLLSLDDSAAFALGVTPARERTLLLLTAVAATALMISVAGVVGWVGLIVPHVARRWLGADARRALPAAILLGGMFGLVCDDLARTLLAGEIPLGILTSLVGSVLFIGLMLSSNPWLRR